MKSSNEEIFRAMESEISTEDRERTFELLEAWIEATERVTGSNDIRTVFLACLNTIATMGPAWCRIASLNLLRVAQEMESEDISEALH